MSNRTNKKAPDNRGNNEEKELEMLLRSIWLGLRYGYKTLVGIDSPDVTDSKHKESIKKEGYYQ